MGMGTNHEFVPMLIERLSISIPRAEVPPFSSSSTNTNLHLLFLPNQVRVNLLRILTRLYKCHPHPKTMIAEFNLYPVVKQLTTDKIVLVQKLASQLLVVCSGGEGG